jgi:hypothetical protein
VRVQGMHIGPARYVLAHHPPERVVCMRAIRTSILDQTHKSLVSARTTMDAAINGHVRILGVLVQVCKCALMCTGESARA